MARESTWGFLFILPWLLGFLLFTAGPMLSSLTLSFYKYDLVTREFVGFENYRRLFQADPLFWKALSNSLIYAAVSTPLGIGLSLGIALMLNSPMRGLPLFRALYYLPSMVPAVASALIWQWVFNADTGVLNQALGFIGLPNIQWLEDERYTLSAFVLMSLWGVGGQRMIIFLAGLQGIPESYYEAARLDGAKKWAQFRHVTLPLLSPVMFFNLVLGLIGSFQVFTSAYVMTKGGPNNASLFYALYIFRNAFEYFKMGKASALAWVLTLILVVITALQFRIGRRWVHYEAESR